MPHTVIEGVLLPFANKKVMLLMNFLQSLCSAELSFIFVILAGVFHRILQNLPDYTRFCRLHQQELLGLKIQDGVVNATSLFEELVTVVFGNYSDGLIYQTVELPQNGEFSCANETGSHRS